MPTHGTLTSILQRLTHAGPRGARTHRARSAARTCRAAALGRIMGVSAAARDPPTAAAAVQRVAEESEELGRILRIEARPLKQAAGGSCGEASAPELDLIIIKDPGSASSCTIGPLYRLALGLKICGPTCEHQLLDASSVFARSFASRP